MAKANQSELITRKTYELAGLGPAAEIEPDLAEWDYGDYEGRRSVDIHKGRPDWNVFWDGCPRGEMPAQVSDRRSKGSILRSAWHRSAFSATNLATPRCGS